MFFRRFCGIVALAIIAPLAAGVVFAGSAAGFILTDDPLGKADSAPFGCRDKIYLYAEFISLSPGPHKAEALWYNPRGKFQDRSVHEFATKQGEGYAVRLWIEMNPSFGGRALGGIDPSIGMKDFIGNWTVELLLDGKRVGERSFAVIC
ncbi:MAG: hypothetical protein OEV59_01710 [Deltaproteobacteria bacterium]|nr:hypothetical protein [Deltaproteobacteria bacterium]